MQPVEAGASRSDLRESHTETEPSFLDRINELADGRRAYFLDLIRIYLGIGLFVKGVQFIMHTDALARVFEGGQFNLATGFISHYIPIAHIAGGVLLAAGFITRAAALIQLPILLGAVFFVHAREGLFTANQSLEFSVLVLFLLAIYAVAGGGPLSVDQYLRRQSERDRGFADPIRSHR